MLVSSVISFKDSCFAMDKQLIGNSFSKERFGKIESDDNNSVTYNNFYNTFLYKIKSLFSLFKDKPVDNNLDLIV